MDAPRKHRNPEAVRSKLDRLREPHIRPLTEFVERLREAYGGDAVPWFDPDEAGTLARILLMLEAPGARATGGEGPRPKAKGSGFVSPDNNDQTAANMWSLLREAGVERRREVVTWNIVPWYVGDGTRIVATPDLDEARPALQNLLALLPHVRVVVLLGRKAAKGWRRIGSDLSALEAPHPSPLVLNPRPEAREDIRATLVEARRIAGYTA